MNERTAGLNSVLHDVSKQWKIVLLLPLFCLIAVAVFLLVTPPVTGYEYSVYAAYPLIFWILAGLIFLFPFVYLYVSHVKRTAIPFSKKSIYGLLAVALLNLVLLLHIPKARGYLMYTGGDALTHIGYCVDILNSGHMLTQNPYPLSHIGISMTSLLTDVSPQIISLSLVSLVIVLFILGIIVLSRALRFTALQKVSIVAVAIIPILGHWLTEESIMPSTIGWAFIPLFLMILYHLLFHRTNLLRYLICWLILCAAMCFVHPEAVLFSAIMTVVIIGFCIIWNLLHRKRSNRCRIYYFPVIPLLIIFVVGFLLFFLKTNHGMGQLSKYMEIFASIFSPATDTATAQVPAMAFSDTFPLWKTHSFSELWTSFFAGEVSFTLFLSSIWSKFVSNTMVYWNLFLLSALCLLTSAGYLVSKRFRSLDKRYLILIVLFVIFVIVSVVLASIYPEMWYIYRVYKYPVIFGIFLLGILFSDFICSTKKSKLRRILSIMAAIAMIFMLFFSMASFYHDPGNGQNNFHITNEDVEAMNLVYDYRNTNYLIKESGLPHQYRFNKYLHGMVYNKKYRKNISDSKSRFPPSNFGYDNHTALGQSYKKLTYYLKAPPYGEFRRWFLNTPENWPFIIGTGFGVLPSSWEHLSYDSSVDKFLDGNSVEAYLIHPII